MGSTHDHSPADPQRALVRARLSRAHGHLHGVIDMIDHDRPYPEILQQIGAVRAALEKATAVIVDDLLSQAQDASKGLARERLEELRKAVKALA